MYVLDRGDASRFVFDTLKQAMFASLTSLKPGQKFAIICWNNGGDDDARYPAQGLANATPSEIEAARQRFGDVYASGGSEPHDAIQRAAELRPGAIVLVTVTAKAFDLDEELVDFTVQARAGSSTKVHTIAIGTEGGAVLPRISKSTRGESRCLTKEQLANFAAPE